VIRFISPPDVSDLPARFPSPFDRAAVHPIARRAAMDTMAVLQWPALAPWRLDEPGNGKMFGVLLVVAPDGTPGYLRAFSGMMAGQWVIDGWAPPAYDAAARDAVWIPGEAEL